ncbi:hypothetical protein F0562_018820 [Nyssa sinensis]|uniref:EF-hand domain-containing protein n=1 Tax=Nyssa sinensis TaxID=561372 RepID=A0A5J4ZCE0_9ASTE|nr:hypothetical protein F0562_018820 [Nyssa sinensis]
MALLQQQSHIPKFGNWDSDNVPYTAYFEIARKEKASGVRMNPNDPEENPDAFIFARGEAGSGDVFPAVQTRVHDSSDKSMSAEKSHTGGHRQHNDHWRNSSNHQKSGSHKSMTSESGSDKSSSDYSPQPNPSHMKSDRKSITEGNNNLSSLSLGPGRLRGGSNPSDDMSYRSVSVPKFGEWDEKSGEGFTVIFNKVKEEKKIAAAKLPTVLPPQPGNYSNNQKQDTRSKMEIVSGPISSCSKEHQKIYQQWFNFADSDGDGRITGNDATKFFRMSNLSGTKLKQVWAIADSRRQGYLGFITAMQLVSIAQAGHKLTPDLLKTTGK